MTNILLITPLNVPFAEAKGYKNGEIKRKLDPKYPVGLLNIGAYVKARVPEVEVRIVDLNTVAPRYNIDIQSTFNDLLLYGIFSQDKLFKEKWAPDIIGISALFSSNYTDVGAMIRWFRKEFPNAIIVAGGHLASACYKKWLEEFPGLDAVCYGEGEIPMAALVFDLSPWHSGWITRKKLLLPGFEPYNIILNNLDAIPPYDLSMLQYPNDYLNTNDTVFTLGTEVGGRDISMFATRGCRYHCSFCSSQFVHGHKVRKYSVGRIKSDIAYYNKEYGMTSFPFLDDDFLTNKEDALAILDFIKGNGWTSRIFNVQYLHVDREVIKALKRTGSDRVLITIDGLNETFLRKVVHKPANFKKAKEVIQICREEGVTVISNLIVGFPGETKEMIEEGVKTMLDMGADWYSVLVAVPFRGSELYEVCREKGYLVREGMDYHDAVIETPDFDPWWIKWKAYEINLRLNFVGNWNMRHGNWEKARTLFDRVIAMIPNHALAHYFAAECVTARGIDEDSWEQYRDAYYDSFYENPEWQEWAKYFNLKEI